MTTSRAGLSRALLAAVAAAFLLRLAFGLFYWNGKPLTHDEREYLALAGSVAAGRGFVYGDGMPLGTGQQFGRAPGYPLFLAAIGAGSDQATETPRRVKVAQSLVGAAGVWVIALLAGRAGGNRVAIAAAWVAAVHPPLVTMPAYVLSETLYSTVALAAALAVQSAMSDSVSVRTRLVHTAVAGAASGAAALIRPAMLLFLPLAVLALLARRRPAAAAVLGVTCLLVILPWTIRNHRVYDRFVLIASEGGVTFWTGNHPLAIGEGDLAANPSIKEAELAFRRAHPGLTAEQMEPLYYRDAFTHIRSDPGWWLSLVARKAVYTVVPIGPSYALHSTKYRVASVVPYLFLLPLAAAGARQLWRRPQPPAAVGLLAGSAVLVSLLFFPQERFRIPVIDPTLIICAAGLAAKGRQP